MIHRIFTLVTACAVLSAFIYFALLAPLSNWRSATMSALSSVQDEIAQLNVRIARLETEKLTFVSDDLTGLTWEGAQVAEATAKVQSAVNDMARRHNISMRSITPTTGADTGIENAISFRLEFETHLDQLVPFLKAVEFGQPALVVTRANLRRLSRPNQNGPQPELFVQIDLAAPVTLTDGRAG